MEESGIMGIRPETIIMVTRKMEILKKIDSDKIDREVEKKAMRNQAKVNILLAVTTSQLNNRINTLPFGCEVSPTQ